MVNPIRFDAAPWGPLLRKEQEHVFWAGVVQLHPESRGWVELKSADPREVAAVTLNVLAEEADREQMRRAFRTTRAIYNTRPMADLIASEKTPGIEVQSDDELDAFIRASCYVAQHPTSTCAMGMGERSVVDAELRVIGVEGLRVADASVMPTVPGGNTNLPCIMIGEKAADLIRGQVAAARRARGRMSRTPQEEANLALVLGMFEHVLNPMDSRAVDRFIAPGYIQHNQSVEPGVASLKAFLDMIKGADPRGGARRQARVRRWRPCDGALSRAPLAGRPRLGGDRHVPRRGRADRRALGRDAGRDRGRAQPDRAVLMGSTLVMPASGSPGQLRTSPGSRLAA